MMCIVKAGIGWVVLMIVGRTLLGLIVRKLVSAPAPEMKDPETELLHSSRFHSAEIARRARRRWAILFGILTILYLYLLFHFLNIKVVIVACLLMVSRFPDLILEIKTGEKIRRKDAPRSLISILAMLLRWATLPFLWLALCH